MVDQGEELIYHDIPSPRSQPQVPTGAVEEEAPPPKKRCSTFTKICAAIIVVCSIALAVIFTRPGSASLFGRTPDAAEGEESGETPTYFPTYWPTYAPTYVPTVAEDDVNATDANATTTDGNATTAAVDGNATITNSTEVPVTTTTTPEFNLTSIIDAIESEIDQESLVDNIIDAINTEIDEATTTTSTLPATTTEKPHPVCGSQTDAKVFKIQITPSDPMASYIFTSVESGEVLSNVTAGILPVGVMTEERICVLPGEYEFSMSSGACVDGYFRGELVLFSCNEGTIVVEVEDKSVEEDEEIVEEESEENV